VLNKVPPAVTYSQNLHIMTLYWQAWNHAFYWDCMKPGGGGKPSGELAAQIDKVCILRKMAMRLYVCTCFYTARASQVIHQESFLLEIWWF
jgi:hypothetical protein